MTVYHVETQKSYDALMIALEELGIKWKGGEKLTDFDEFKTYGKDTYIYEEHGVVSFSDGDYFESYYSNETLIEYKAKGETKMTNEEMKQKIHGLATHVSIATESLARDIKFESKESTVEFDLKEAKSSAKKLIENIEEYLEYLKPKFKVGDYVTDTSGNNPYICKIEEIEGHELVGNWYCFKDNHLDKSIVLPISTSRLSTPEEIAEYKTALNFYKHGRDPFEVKKGDLIRTPSEKFTLILYPENYTKEEFLDYGWEFLKTVEEVSEWAGADDE